MPDNLTIGYSPCPNDTFIFHALATGIVPWDGELAITLADVEELNGRAMRSELDVVKVSAAAAGSIADEYMLLRAGGAMGYGVGPLLVAKEGVDIDLLNGKRVAIPGKMTTANMIFGLCCRTHGVEVEIVEMVFDEVMPAVQAGKVEAGLVIHEGRFTFDQYGLTKVLDLGAWWERHTGLPIPLGAIAIRRSLGRDVALRMNEAIRQSLLSARSNPAQAEAYIKQHAQEMEDAVIKEHIATFVTDYSLDVGDGGAEAVARLLGEAGCGREDIFLTL